MDDCETASKKTKEVNPYREYLFNPHVTSALSYSVNFNLRGIRSNFSFLFHFPMIFMKAKRLILDWTLRLGYRVLGVTSVAFSFCHCTIKGR